MNTDIANILYIILWIAYLIWVNKKYGIEVVERLRKITSFMTIILLLYIIWFTEPKTDSKWFATISLLVMFGSIYLIWNRTFHNKMMEEAKQANFPQISYFLFQLVMVVVCAGMSFLATISVISYILTGNAQKL